MKTKVNFKMYEFTNWNKITINVLPDIFKSKARKALECGQLTDYNMINIFL